MFIHKPDIFSLPMRLFAVVFLSLILSSSYVSAQDLKVVNLQCDQQSDPSGLSSAAPKLSWQLQTSAANTMQIAYRILVSDRQETLRHNTGNVWDSGVRKSSASIEVPYLGKPLRSAQTYYWKVMVWDNHKKQSAWSAIQRWQTGLNSKSDWKGASWIAHQVMADSIRILPSYAGKRDQTNGTMNDILPLIRKEINIRKKIKEATMYISGLGHFELQINGNKIGDHFLDPGWTDYESQAQYVPFDVTKALTLGENAIGITLGNGFYYIPKQKKRFRKLLTQYGYPKLICRLAIKYTDGSDQDIVSDASWKTAPAPTIFSSIYGGEDYDANLEQQNWSNPGFKDNHWARALITTGPPQLIAQRQGPVKIFDQFNPTKVSQVKQSWVYDLAQNASGIVRIAVKGKKGDTVRITPSELLSQDGLASQSATGKPYYFTYVLKGEGTEVWSPKFTYYGFRYVQVDGAVPTGKDNPKQLPEIMELHGLHVRNAAAAAGDFQSSNTLFNQTAKLIDWAVKSNMMSVFTDCPHREKLGWLEQLHLMGSSLRYTYQVQHLLYKAVEDMQNSQLQNGLVPEISPEYTVFTWGGDMFRDSPEWGSSSIILPWYLYEWYGDRQRLASAYPMMQKYAEYLKSKAKDDILYQGLGDWYDLGPKPPGVSQQTTTGITATAIYYYDLTILAKTANLLGKAQDAKRYLAMADQVRKAFNQKFFNEGTQNYGSGSQTANAMAVYMKLVQPEHKAAVVNNLISDIKKNNYGLTSGDIGYRYLLRVLEDEGQSDLIYEMNSRNDVPGYGYQLAQGATALTESWQALPTVSNNHLMLGHLQEWFYSGLGGIRQQPGSIAFRHILIHPELPAKLDRASANYQSPYGKIGTSWVKSGGRLQLDIEIPANTDAMISLPAQENQTIAENGKALSRGRVLRFEQGRAILKTGSGQYSYTVE